MKTSESPLDSKTQYAAQNAREGLINVVDLSLLTGVPTTQLTGYAKKGMLVSYGEYHGKRFYKFEEVINSVMSAEANNDFRRAVMASIETLLKHPDCPYAIEEVADGSGRCARVSWKELPAAA